MKSKYDITVYIGRFPFGGNHFNVHVLGFGYKKLIDIQKKFDTEQELNEFIKKMKKKFPKEKYELEFKDSEYSNFNYNKEGD